MATQNQPAQELRERPLGEVAKDLTNDLSLLVRQEVELARAEMTLKARRAAPGLGMFGGAGLLALCSAGSFTAFLVLLVSLFLPAWAAAVIVCAALAATAYVLVQQGRTRIGDAGKPFPEETIEAVKEDIEWTKSRASSARR